MRNLVGNRGSRAPACYSGELRRDTADWRHEDDPPSYLFPPKERYECNASTGYCPLPNEGGESLGMKPYLVLEEGLVFPFVD